jgi:hypothetical protein
MTIHWTEIALGEMNLAYYYAHINEFKDAMKKRGAKYDGDNSMVHGDEVDLTSEEIQEQLEREQEKADKKYHEMKESIHT